jgi:hypothetical protein
MHLQITTSQFRLQLTDGAIITKASLYPIDMSHFLHLNYDSINEVGVPYQLNPAGYHPTLIVQYALAHWNQYCVTKDEHHLNVFLAQLRWLVEHEIHIGTWGGWPIPFPHLDAQTNSSWLSALTQGCALSLLVRAYQFNHEENLLETLHRAARTFEQDILDGGICTPIGDDGIFFEESAVYPAAHKLSGFIFALLGLYDYVSLTDDPKSKELIQNGLSTMHLLLDEFDVGYCLMWAIGHV